MKTSSAGHDGAHTWAWELATPRLRPLDRPPVAVWIRNPHGSPIAATLPAHAHPADQHVRIWGLPDIRRRVDRDRALDRVERARQADQGLRERLAVGDVDNDAFVCRLERPFPQERRVRVVRPRLHGDALRSQRRTQRARPPPAPPPPRRPASTDSTPRPPRRPVPAYRPHALVDAHDHRMSRNACLCVCVGLRRARPRRIPRRSTGCPFFDETASLGVRR